MNTDRAYILGLVIGGGEFGANRNSFYIKLPFKQWGDIEKNPKRASEIGKDIMKVVGPIMRTEYGLSVSYEIGKREWKIICDGNLSETITQKNPASLGRNAAAGYATVSTERQVMAW